MQTNQNEYINNKLFMIGIVLEDRSRDFVLSKPLFDLVNDKEQ